MLLLVTATSLAERIAPPTLPASAFTDTEASTNIVMTPLACSRTFSVALALDATASNCVEVAVGNDPAHLDGDLAPSGESLRLGWDCGNWFLSAPGLANRVEIAPVQTEVRKTLTLRLGVNSNGAVRDVSLLDGGATLPVGPLALPVASSWNMLRVTVRGIDPALGDLVVRHSPDGTRLIFQ